MTLHEAISKLLQQTGRPMTTQEIADQLNVNGWYKKKDKSTILPFQIHRRTKNYASIFNREGSTVSLIEQSIPKIKHIIPEKKAVAKPVAKIVFQNTKISFPPISNNETAILILGTLPGDKSLELGEYYGHTRNRFWDIISTITGKELPITYSDKQSLLLKSNIGIWDVAHKAIRKGSLDSEIQNVEPNDLDEFIAVHKKLKVVAFNGSRSQVLFDKHFDRISGIKYISLPSTSPANTRMNFKNICKLWQEIIAK